jgi:predicted mannosyl-3-phosphoglycerate phosphatase (HAD superfamily)
MTLAASAAPSRFVLRMNPRGAARPLLLTHVEDALLDGATPLGDVSAGLAAVARDVEVVLASGQTVEELIYLLHELGADADLIAENGACTAVRSPAVARALGARETLTRRGRRWYVVSPGAPAAEVRAAVERTRAEHGEEIRLAPELPSTRRLELLGGHSAARLALSRRCSVLAEPPLPGSATDACVAALRHQGYHAAIDRRWLTIWRGPDSGEAARAYLAARRDAGGRPAEVAAVGGAPNDVPLLRAASTRFVVRRPDGRHDPRLLAVPGAVALDRVGHAGWREAAARLGARP